MLERTIYGIEYDPRQKEREPSGLGWIVALVAIATLVSLGVTLVRRLNATVAEKPETVTVAVKDVEPASPAVPAAKSAAEAEKVRPPAVISTSTVNRPQIVKNLLMRLEEANRRRDVQLQATTIEQLRSQPGAADLDDALARRLGILNIRRLFALKSREWVEQVEVKRGDSASRIASEHGSTFASFSRLNDGKVDPIRLGSKLYVMSRPKFSLTVHRRLKFADLQLNGKFFKRYDLLAEPKLANGAYVWGAVGAELPLGERDELEMMLPRSTVTVVSEL